MTMLERYGRRWASSPKPDQRREKWRIPTAAIIPAAIKVIANPMLKDKTRATPSQIRFTWRHNTSTAIAAEHGISPPESLNMTI
jgi:hypothetical protein